VIRPDLNHPPTSVGGIPKALQAISVGWNSNFHPTSVGGIWISDPAYISISPENSFCRLELKLPPTSVGGIWTFAAKPRWCSAAWFERVTHPAMVKTIYSFKTDKLNIFDDF